MSNSGYARTSVIVALALLGAACASDAEDGARSRVGARASISHIHGLGVDRAGTLYVATHDGLIKPGSGSGWVYASADTNDHMGFSLHPADGVMYRSGHSAERPSLGVESSTDGARWTHIADVADPPVDFHAMAVSFADSTMLWGWDSGGRGTFRSTDGGKTWTPLELRGVAGRIYALAGSAEPSTVYAGTATGLYRSADGGVSWESVKELAGGWVVGVAADPKRPGRMLAFTQRGMRATSDGGRTWSDAGNGLPQEAGITSIAISPADPEVAYAADSSTIYTTTDGAESWTTIPAS